MGIPRKALIFIVLTSFLSAMGMSILSPIAPFIVSRYVSDQNSMGVIVAALSSIYAICTFFAAPGLGALSDRYGRRPILLVCLLGSAIGYLVFGLGGALWVLFLARIIDGVTGGNITVAYAYIADLTPPGERGKYFGWIGALSGIGLIAGPALGGLLAKADLSAPLYFAAALTMFNVIYGYFFMPESLKPEQRATTFNVTGLNPFSALGKAFSITQVRWLLIAVFLYALPFAGLANNMGLFAKDALNWDVATTGALFAFVGVTDIFVQGLLLPRLLKRFGEAKVALIGLAGVFIGYLLIASVALVSVSAVMYVGTVMFALGDGLVGPSISGLISRAADARSQGLVQGGSQSVQSLARVIGPLAGGEMYDALGHASLYLAGAAIALVTIGFVGVALPNLRAEEAVEETQAAVG